MITNLEKYSDAWNWQVNLTKSMVMIFRNGDKLRKNDKWRYRNERVEIVMRFKYVGMTFTPYLSWDTYLNKSNLDKIAITSVWQDVITKKEAPIFSKYTVFNAVVRTEVCVMSCGLQGGWLC